MTVLDQAARDLRVPAAAENSAEAFVGVQIRAQVEAGLVGGEQGSRDRAHLPVAALKGTRPPCFSG